jgi:DNA-binding beta-propeller fold protein YncE
MKNVLIFVVLIFITACSSSPEKTADIPQFKVDPFWPKPLPGNWMLGQVAGIAVDRNDNIWIVHRPGTLLDDEKGAQKHPPETKCCTAAPAVLQFDQAGNLLRSWGGPGQGYDWFESEHGIFVDKDDNVWVGGNSPKDHHIVQFTADGKFIKQLGRPGKSEGSNSTTQLGRPAHMQVDAAANELYVADGYGNRRIIVFDATTLAYKRHWGAYGEKPTDDKLPAYNPAVAMRSFQNPVHCVRFSNDGLVYVCDRQNDRIQVFEKSGKFVKEIFVERETLQNGSVWDLVLSEDPAQKYLFVANGANGYMIIVERATGQVLGTFGRPGRMAGEFRWVHNLAIDSKGNLYTAEVGFGRRVQKFSRVAN